MRSNSATVTKLVSRRAGIRLQVHLSTGPGPALPTLCSLAAPQACPGNGLWAMKSLGHACVSHPEIKFPTSAGSWKKQERSSKTCTSALLTMPKPLCGSQQTVECTIYSTLLCFYFFFQVISLYCKAFQVKIILTDFY